MPGLLSPSPVLVERGGGSIASDTRDPTAFPTTPPASTQTHFKSIPKIAGSEGGFIGLVVGLGVIFIGCCIGIFFLLRHRRHGGRLTRSKSGKVGVEDPSGRRGTLFGWRSSNPKRSGWVRASGGEEGEDEWDARDEFDSVQRLPYRQQGGGGRNRDAMPMESVHELNGKTYDSLDAPAPSPGASAVNLVAPDAHESWRPRSPAEEESLSHSVYDHDHEHDPSDHDGRNAKHMSMDSTVSFPGGTKFREAL
ncbi:hypothetical protein SCHPADRAFT_899979 [Schizopora paradoxa]|uniref:Uncharacterized protein n=1 Tax=Schizopora paradoxa TaxID=27342 RepID=A0A0H2S926_9AGAM|nr:hypothetical protein SCHPADRAFT_899979 [Schizopora paradoxa]